jgi:hypothetical protein
MRVARAWVQLALGLILVCAAALGGWIVYGQLVRDRECVGSVRKHVELVEAFRGREGRLPRLDELHAEGPAVIGFRAEASGEYELSMWRGERAVHYASATDRTTCDSGALQAVPWLAVLLLMPGLVLGFLGSRKMRRRGGARC